MSAPTLERCEDRVLLADVLGTAQNFAILGASTVISTGATAIVGNVGVSSGTPITGFPPGVITGGAMHAGDAVASQAHADLVTAYGVIAGEASPPGGNLTGDDLGGLTLLPGVYHFATSASLSGTLTLNAQGNPDARFDFQIGTALTTASGSAVQFINGAQADNVYFQVGGSATLGSNATFEGSILADQSVTLNAGASILEGRALALTGSVTLDANQVSASEADLSVSNTSSAGNVLAGSDVSYTISVANAGPDAAQSVALSELVPTNTTFVSDTQTSGPAFNIAAPAQGGTGAISGTIGALASGASASFVVVVLVTPSAPAGTTITNTANVNAATGDPNLANNSAAATNLTATQADLSATNSASAGTVLAGNLIAYTITLANAGPSDAQNVGATNFPPANTTFVSEAQTSGPAFGAGSPGSTDIAFIATLPAGTSASFTFVVQVLPSTLAGTTITDTTTIGSDTNDPNLANNSATFTNLTATQANLSVSQTIAPGPVAAGDDVTYTVTISNAGPSDAQTVALADLVPANTTFVSDAQASGPAFNLTSPAAGGTGTINATIGALAADGSASFTVVVLVSLGTPNGTTISNTVDVTGATTDPNLGNNTSTVTTGTVAGTGADLSVTNTTAASTVLAGSAVAYTVTLANAGPDAAQDVTASGLVPADTTFVSATQLSGPAFSLTSPAQGGTGTITETLATLPSDDSATFTVVFLVSPNTPAGTAITHVVNVSSATSDPNLANNSASATSLTATQADLSAVATTAAGPVIAGKTITYTIRLANAGPSDAQNVLGTVDLPANTSFVSGGQTSGPAFAIANPMLGGTSTITATIASLASGDSASFTLVLLLSPSEPAGTMFSTIGVITSATADPDLTNNSRTNTFLTAAQADVSVTNTVASVPALAGDVATYNITVSNAGPSDAQTVALSDLVPANTTFVSAAQTSGSAFNLTTPAPGGTGTINGTIGTLAAGASASFAVKVIVPPGTSSGTTITSTAAVTTATTDPNLANNSQTVTSFSATQADVSVTATTAGQVLAGNPVTYTITVSNAGPSDAQAVAISDLVPADTTFVSDAQTSGPAFALTSPAAGGIGTIGGTIATLASGASASFAVVVLVSSSTPVGTTIADTAAVTAGTTDPNLANNSRTVTTVVTTPVVTTPGPAVVSLQPSGLGNRPTSLVITFSTPLTPARARNAANYQVVTLRGPGPRGFKKGAAIRVKNVIYNALAQTVTLRLAKAMNIHKFYQITITGASHGGITGADGAPLAGAGTGPPGSNFVGVISPKSTAAALPLAIRSRLTSETDVTRAVDGISPSALDELAVSGQLNRGRDHAEVHSFDLSQPASQR